MIKTPRVKSHTRTVKVVSAVVKAAAVEKKVRVSAADLAVVAIKMETKKVSATIKAHATIAATTKQMKQTILMRPFEQSVIATLKESNRSNFIPFMKMQTM